MEMSIIHERREQATLKAPSSWSEKAIFWRRVMGKALSLGAENLFAPDSTCHSHSTEWAKQSDCDILDFEPSYLFMRLSEHLEKTKRTEEKTERVLGASCATGQGAELLVATRWPSLSRAMDGGPQVCRADKWSKNDTPAVQWGGRGPETESGDPHWEPPPHTHTHPGLSSPDAWASSLQSKPRAHKPASPPPSNCSN